MYALQYGLRLGSAVALLGALTAWTMIGRKAAAASEGSTPELIAHDARVGEQDGQAAVAGAAGVHV